MTRADYLNQFDDAMRKAFAARAPEVRLAYFELAQFYRRGLACGGASIGIAPADRSKARAPGLS